MLVVPDVDIGLVVLSCRARLVRLEQLEGSGSSLQMPQKYQWRRRGARSWPKNVLHVLFAFVPIFYMQNGGNHSPLGIVHLKCVISVPLIICYRKCSVLPSAM